MLLPLAGNYPAPMWSLVRKICSLAGANLLGGWRCSSHCAERGPVRPGLPADNGQCRGKVAAEICSMDDLSRPIRRVLAQSAEEFSRQLSSALGKKTARAEVNRALRAAILSRGEAPYALRRLRLA